MCKPHLWEDNKERFECMCFSYNLDVLIIKNYFV